ncbi:MAG TPA: ATP-binding cassette domain-containing protein, partial [Chloroflexota bacterium]
MSLLTLSDVSKHFGAEKILEGVSLRIERDDHVGLVGSNGAGKSTLLRIMAGLEEPDSGTVGRARGLVVGYLAQEPEFVESDTLYEVMLAVFREAIEAQERNRELEDQMAQDDHGDALMEEYGRLQAIVEHAGYDYQSQIERVLTGLGFPAESWTAPISTMSGGQRTRANLGRTLLQDADVLLLDEPTNHLDIPAVEWLESYLRDLKRAFVIVAHDRYLLDRVTQRTVELSQRHLTSYDSPYGRYLQLRAERMERRQQEYEAQQEHIAKTEEFIRRYGAGQRY